MTYQRPVGMKYTDMAIYVDANIHNTQDPEVVQRVFEYIYHLTYMLSCKDRMWEGVTAKDFDEFALYAASRVYVRLTNPRQFEVKEGERPLKPVKSVLNYLKFVIPKLKVRYQEESFTQIFSDKHGSDTNAMQEEFRRSVQSSYNEGLPEEVQVQLGKVVKITKDVIKSSPYKKDTLMMRRIYLSCLLTLLNNFTLPNKELNKIRQKEARNKDVDETLYKLYDKQSEDSVILWRLDDIFKDYIDILVKKIKRKMVSRIGDTTSSFELPTETLDQIWNSAWGEYVDHNEGEDYQ